MSVRHLYLIAVAAILGCAAPSATSDRPGSPAPPRRGNYLSFEEIAAASADVMTVYDALSRLRPAWLAPRGQTSFNSPGTDYAAVFVDGQLYGELNSLRNLQASQVADIRYYNITEAGAKFGLRAGSGGAIEIRSRTR
jgi:hypothetical protein